MKYRKSLSRPKSKRTFRASSGVHPLNDRRNSPYRGGIRL